MRKKEGETRAKRSMFYANGIRVFRARFFRPTTQFRCLLFTVLFSLLLIIRNKRKGGKREKYVNPRGWKLGHAVPQAVKFREGTKILRCYDYSTRF